MFRTARIAPTVFGMIFVVLVTVFVARLLGSLAAMPTVATVPNQTQCEVSVDIVCPVG